MCWVGSAAIGVCWNPASILPHGVTHGCSLHSACRRPPSFFGLTGARRAGQPEWLDLNLDLLTRPGACYGADRLPRLVAGSVGGSGYLSGGGQAVSILPGGDWSSHHQCETGTLLPCSPKAALFTGHIGSVKGSDARPQAHQVCVV